MLRRAITCYLQDLWDAVQATRWANESTSGDPAYRRYQHAHARAVRRAAVRGQGRFLRAGKPGRHRQ
jgi:hypothetical protein